MKYLLAIYADEGSWDEASPEEAKRFMDAYGEYTKEIQGAGVMLAGEGLEPTPSAKTVRVRGGARQVTDGPFAETKEQLGGFYLVDVGSMDEALEWAGKIPGARVGSIEVRPVLDYEALGYPAGETG